MNQAILCVKESSIAVKDEETIAVEPLNDDDDNNRALETNIEEKLEHKSSKRQRSSSDNVHCEMSATRNFRRETFRTSNYSDLFINKLVEAGFAYCTKPSGGTICLHCNFIFYDWNEAIDDPTHVHRTVSPNCYFVQNKLKQIDMSAIYHQYDQVKPADRNFLDVAERRKSFGDFADAETFANAGFHYSNGLIKCFHCDGSCPMSKFKFHPLFEHVGRFPGCVFAMNQCGSILHKKVRRAVEKEKFIDGNDQNRLTLSDATNSSMDITRRSIDQDSRKKSTCSSFDDRLNSLMENCRRQSLEQNRIRIPHVEMTKKLDEYEFPFSTEENSSDDNSNDAVESVTSVAQSFSDELKKYQEQKKSAVNFIEDSSVIRQREFQAKKKNIFYPEFTLSQFCDSGWIFSQSGKSTKCIYCGIEFNCWKNSDDPMVIHQKISPLCSFILASASSTNHKMRQRNSIPTIKPMDFRDDASGRQKIVLPSVAISTSPYFQCFERRKTFEENFHNSLRFADDFARAGWFYVQDLKMVECFYCHRRSNFSTDDQQTPQHEANCGYHQQRTDEDRCQLEVSKPSQCEWCENGKAASHVILPCRHLSVCADCSEIRHYCPRCWQEATKFMKIHH